MGILERLYGLAEVWAGRAELGALLAPALHVGAFPQRLVASGVLGADSDGNLIYEEGDDLPPRFTSSGRLWTPVNNNASKKHRVVRSMQPGDTEGLASQLDTLPSQQ